MNSPSQPERPKQNRLRRILTVLGAGAILVVILFFALTSEYFLKRAVLPRVSKLLGAEVTAVAISFSPFSKLELEGLRVEVPQPPNDPGSAAPLPVFFAERVLIRYRLRNLLTRGVDIESVGIDKPTLEIVTAPDGSSNLDPILRALATTSPPPQSTSSPESVPSFHLRNLAVRSAALRFLKTATNGASDRIEISEMNIGATNLGPGKLAAFTWDARLLVSQQARASNAAAQRIEASLEGKSELKLDDRAHPRELRGNSRLVVGKSTGQFAPMQGLEAHAQWASTASQILEAQIAFRNGGKQLSSLRVSGPLALAVSGGEIEVVIDSIDHQVLNLAGAPMGLDFGATTLSSTNRIRLDPQSKGFEVAGRLSAQQLSVRANGNRGATPPVDLGATYHFSIHAAQASASIEELQVTARVRKAPLFEASLTAPMTFAWATAAAESPQAQFRASLTDLDLSEWSTVLGPIPHSGRAGFQLEIGSVPLTRALRIEAKGRVENLVLELGSGPVQAGTCSIEFGGAWDASIARLAIEGCVANLQHPSRGSLRLEAAGEVVPSPLEARIETSLALDLPVITALLAQPSPGSKPGPAPPSSKSTLEGTAALNFNPKSKSTLEAAFAFTNLFASTPSPSQRAPSVNARGLDGRIECAASFEGAKAELSQCLIQFERTSRAENEIQISGAADFTHPAGSTSNFKLVAKSLDLTPMLALSSPAPEAAPVPPPGSGTPDPSFLAMQVEPLPISMGVRDARFEARIGSLFLGDLALSGLDGRLSVEENKVNLESLQLRVQDAPVSARALIDFGVPGFTYDLALDATSIPLKPLVDAFSADYRNRAQGDLSAHLQARGSGLTGASLQKNLEAAWSVSITNASVALIGRTARLVLTPIAAVLGLGDLTRSPLTRLNAAVTATGGRIQLNEFKAATDLFVVHTKGEIPIAPRLADSPLRELPIQFSLERMTAAKANLVPPNTPTNVAFVQLPDFAHLSGTIENVQVKTDKLVIAGLLGKSAARLPGKLGENAAGILDNVGDLFGGKQDQPVPPESTNSPPKRGLLDIFKKRPPPTNSPAP